MARTALTAALILLMAGALRILGAGDFPLWTDEGWSVWASAPGADTVEILANDRHPPLYFVLLAAWRDAAGDSRLALRFLSIAAGLLTVAAVYRIGADAGGRHTGALAAAAAALLPILVYYGQEVRHYGLFTLWVALSWLLLMRLLRRPSRWRWAAYAVVAAAMLYTLYFGALILLAQMLAALLHRRRAAGLTAGMAGAALFLPWLALIIERQAGFLALGIGANPGTLRLPADLLGALALLFGTIFVVWLAYWLRGAAELARSAAHRPLWIAGVVPPLALFGAGVVVPLLAPRVLVMLAPPMLALAAYSLRRDAIWARAAALALLLVGGGDLQPRLPIDDAAALVAAGYQAGDAVILETGWDDNAAAYEVARLLPAGAPIVRMLAYLPQRPDAPAPPRPPAADIIAPYARVWVVHWLTAPHVRAHLEGGDSGWARLSAAEVSALPYGASFNAPIIYVGLYAR